MRILRLQTNLRRKQLTQWRAVVGVVVTISLGMLIFASQLWHDTQKDMEMSALLRRTFEQVSTDIEALEVARSNVSIDEDVLAWLTLTVPALNLSGTPPAARILFELEKLTPERVILSSFEYQAAGQVDVVAITEKRSELTYMLTLLQRSSVFKNIQVVNQRESNPGKFEAHIKFEITP